MNVCFFILTLLVLTAESIRVLVVHNGQLRPLNLDSGSEAADLETLVREVFGVKGPVALKHDGKIRQPQDRVRNGEVLELILTESIRVLVTYNGVLRPFNLDSGSKTADLEKLVREVVGVKGPVTLKHDGKIRQPQDRVRNGEVLELILTESIIVHVTYQGWRQPFYLLEGSTIFYLKTQIRKRFRIEGSMSLKQDERILQQYETVHNGAKLKLFFHDGQTPNFSSIPYKKVAVTCDGQWQLFELKDSSTFQLEEQVRNRFGLKGPVNLIHDGRRLEYEERVARGAELEFILLHNMVTVTYNGQRKTFDLPFFTKTLKLKKLVRKAFSLYGPVTLMHNKRVMRRVEVVPHGAELELILHDVVTVTYKGQRKTFDLPFFTKTVKLKKLVCKAFSLYGPVTLMHNGRVMRRMEVVPHGAKLELILPMTHASSTARRRIITTRS